MTKPDNNCCSDNPAEPDNSQQLPEDDRKQACCSPQQSSASCCPPPTAPSECDATDTEIAGYSIYPFVTGWLDSPVGKVPQISSKLTFSDHRGRWAMRWGIGRNQYQITPGLYALGQPNSDSPVIVSANYKLSFDCLRSALNGESTWILILDTKGINVWCAAGKGTFGTEEIVHRCRKSKIDLLVNHRQLIVPQLGAPGIAAFKVKQDTGFTIVYGPVRAVDLKTFLENKMQATPKMRQVSFNLLERLVLTPVEITIMIKPILISILVLFILSGIGADIFSFSAAVERGLAAVVAGLAGVITGCVLTPLFLPWLPTRAFSSKGAILGLLTATILALGPYRETGISGLLSLYLLVIAVSSYMAMNFTGSTTFTSPSGVEKEMRTAIPCQALALLTAGLLWIGAAF